jgi:epoxyqueuosine reductase
VESIQEKSKWIKDRAKELGFIAIGYAKAEFMEDEAARLKEWLGLGYHGKMSYMENHFEKRTDPTQLVENARTVISFAYNYYTDKEQQDATAPKISQYAYGRDYHKVVKKKLKILEAAITEKYGTFNNRYFVDSAPVLERDWAKRSGIGWIGKNTLLINPKLGSFFFLAEMIVDFELDYGVPISDYCGTCTKCIEACPTDAIAEEGYVMNGSKCISYLTIELKDEHLPEEYKGKMENWMYGCDICQDVCPWNRFSKEHTEEDFLPSDKLMAMNKEDWASLSEQQFDDLFFGSAVKRTKYKGLKRNIEFLNT